MGAPSGENEIGSNSPHEVHAVRVEATQPKLGNAMRVAATHPSNNTQWNEGGSDTPYTVIKEATEMSKLKYPLVGVAGVHSTQ